MITWPGRGPLSYEAVQDTGFGHGFGRLDANRELVEWMRLYNADPEHRVKLRFYGFDIPGLEAGIASPAQVLHFVLDYLASIDSHAGQEQRQRIDSLLGPDYDWENPEAMADPAKSVGLSPAATQLRIETEELILELRTRRPELVAKSDIGRYSEALQYATVARELLNFHAASARKSGELYARLLGIRDALMADNLAYIVGRNGDGEKCWPMPTTVTCNAEKRSCRGLHGGRQDRTSMRCSARATPLWERPLAFRKRTASSARKPALLKHGWLPGRGRCNSFQLTKAKGFCPRRSHRFPLAPPA